MNNHALIIILVIGIITMATRLVPVLIFGRGKRVPEYIMYLGKVVPYTAMGLLIVYCFKDLSIFYSSHGMPELIAMIIVVISYLWKRNSILSVVVGTIAYMALVQYIFV